MCGVPPPPPLPSECRRPKPTPAPVSGGPQNEAPTDTLLAEVNEYIRTTQVMPSVVWQPIHTTCALGVVAALLFAMALILGVA